MEQKADADALYVLQNGSNPFALMTVFELTVIIGVRGKGWP